MSAIAPFELIDVQALRVGMFVHLEGGWMAHPFPLSRFKLASAEQIATIRSLGLKQVRWVPTLSDATGSASGGLDSERHAVSAATEGLPHKAVPSRARPNDKTAASVSAPALTRSEHRAQLTRQREALRICEHQFSEAQDACTELTRVVQARPLEAGQQAKALSRTLVGKMLGDEELCIQLLTGAAGNKASAHAMNVSVLSLLLGRKLGLSEAQMMDVGVGAMLHDVGKLDLSERARHRESDFTAAEVKAYEEHVALGVAQALRMGLSSGAALVVAQHHELSDGSGFPLKLGADKLTLPSRIVALVNRYDNLCNPNLAAKAMTPHAALAFIYAGSAMQFDALVLGHFIKMMGVYPAGSAVQLSDDRFALVVNVNSTRPLKPRVLVYDAKVPRDEALMLDLQSQPGLSIRRSLKPHQLPPPVLSYLAPARRVAYFFEPATLEPAGFAAATLEPATGPGEIS